jgi:dephospho-CoA kinase
MSNFISVGLTGGIASGKSTVAQIFKSKGIPVLDSDQISRDLVSVGSQTLSEIVMEFGDDILDKSGNLNRTKLGEIIFSDPVQREILNDIMHPKIQKEQKKWLQKKRIEGESKIAAIEAALMIESGGYKNFDFLVVVKCSEKNQYERLEKRNNLLESSIKARLNSQMSMEKKTQYADWVLDNSDDLDSIKSQVSLLVNKLFSMVQL